MIGTVVGRVDDAVDDDDDDGKTEMSFPIDGLSSSLPSSSSLVL